MFFHSHDGVLAHWEGVGDIERTIVVIGIDCHFAAGYYAHVAFFVYISQANLTDECLVVIVLYFQSN